MLLRNYYNLLACGVLGKHIYANGFGDGNIIFKGINGLLYYSSFAPTIGAVSLGRCISNNIETAELSYSSIIIGNGTTPVTFDDYKLDSQITSGWTKTGFVINTPTYDSVTKKFSNTVTFIITNTSTSELIFSEVGIVGQYGSTPLLLYREVLDTPITVAPGESVTFTQNFEFTMPTIA